MRIDQHTITHPPDQEARQRPVGRYEDVNSLELGQRVADQLEFMEHAHEIVFHYYWRICQAREAEFK